MPVTINGSGGFTANDGSAAAPSIAGTDSNTGVFFPAADTVAIATGGTERMRVDSSGNATITSSAGGLPLYVDSTAASQNVRVRLNVNQATSSVAYVWSNSSAGVNKQASMYLTSSGALATQVNQTPGGEPTSGTTATFVDSSGNFLVGKTSADNSSPGVWLYNNSAQAGRINIAKNTSGLFNALTNYHSNTYVGGINYDNTSTSFPTSSDIRLKIDIVDAGSASAKIEQIRVVAHGWKHDEAKVEFGVIAQELYQIAPQAVSAGDDGEEIQTTWGVDYSKLVPMLIKAHQEQQALIESLTARIAALEAA